MKKRKEKLYEYDANGNLLGESGSHRTAGYVYNAQNRMTRSTVYDTVAGTLADTVYAYDAFGRRTLTRDDGGIATRTIYDGFGFDVIRESGAFESGALTDMYDEGAGYVAGRTGEANGGRYRLLDAGGAARAVTNDRLSGGTGRAALRGDTDAAGSARRFTGERLPLYSGGYAVGVGVDGAAMYLGTDVMGSVRSVTDGYGAVESLRGYDIFGTPYDVSAGGSDFSGAFAGASAGGSDFAGGVAYGYAGKQYDTVTGMYDYGFRDYSPASARFTTPDPIRDGRNWFSYVNNDPVNFVDLWGLMASEQKQGNGSQINWTNNMDGTYTAKAGATLWELQQLTNIPWQSFGIYDPTQLEIGTTVGRKNNSQSTVVTPNTTTNNNLTMILPASGRISSEFGSREVLTTSNGKQTNPYHGGIDIANTIGTPIFAAASGKVLENNYSEQFGNYVIISHSETGGWNGTLTYYAHMDKPSDIVVGTTIQQGDKIGKMGQTGYSTGPHLHFEVRDNYGHDKHDPMDYIIF